MIYHDKPSYNLCVFWHVICLDLVTLTGTSNVTIDQFCFDPEISCTNRPINTKVSKISSFRNSFCSMYFWSCRAQKILLLIYINQGHYISMVYALTHIEHGKVAVNAPNSRLWSKVMIRNNYKNTLRVCEDPWTLWKMVEFEKYFQRHLKLFKKSKYLLKIVKYLCWKNLWISKKSLWSLLSFLWLEISVSGFLYQDIFIC